MGPLINDAAAGADLVLGLGGCLDYEIVWNPDVVQSLVDEYGIEPHEASTDVEVDSERDLVCSILGFLREGVGGERYVASSAVVRDVAARFERRVALGGTNVRAAVAMSRIGVAATLHLVSIDDHVRRLLPAGVDYVCSATADSTDPHLIVQYPAGARVRLGEEEVVSPAANRLIYVNDVPNRDLALSRQLGRMLAGAGLFLVSGFNAMRNPALLERRLDELRRAMAWLPPAAKVIYEDAGFHVPSFRGPICERLVERVDVWGMNEDELQAYVGAPVDLLDAEAVAGALRALQRVVPARVLVVHTSAWSLAYGPRSREYRTALRGGNALAGARFGHGDTFTRSDHRRVDDGPRHSGGERFAEQVERRLGELVCCEAAFRVECPTPTTVGLGDTFVGGFIAALAGSDAGAPPRTAGG